MKNKKNKKSKYLTRRYVFLSILLITILTIFTVWFSISYSQNKVKPFEEDLKEATYEKITAKDSVTVLDDFTFELYCSEYFSVSKSKAKFLATAYDKKSDNGKITNINLNAMLAADFINFTSSNTTSTLSSSDKWWNSTNHDEDNTEPFNSKNPKATLTISGVNETFPKKSFFFGMKVKPKLYVILSYTQTKNGVSKDKKFLIEYSYDEYFTSKTL